MRKTTPARKSYKLYRRNSKKEGEALFTLILVGFGLSIVFAVLKFIGELLHGLWTSGIGPVLVLGSIIVFGVYSYLKSKKKRKILEEQELIAAELRSALDQLKVSDDRSDYIIL